MALEHRRGAHSVHAIAYHLVWCVKYRKTLLTRQIGDRVKEIVTDRRIFQEFPHLKWRLWGGHLWSPSYFAATVGGAPLSTIKQYVKSQRTK